LSKRLSPAHAHAGLSTQQSITLLGPLPDIDTPALASQRGLVNRERRAEAAPKPTIVIPAQAGIQTRGRQIEPLASAYIDLRLRGDDD
jgi:hypothetical protein